MTAKMIATGSWKALKSNPGGALDSARSCSEPTLMAKKKTGMKTAGNTISGSRGS